MKASSETTTRFMRHELDSWRPFLEALHEDERRAFRSLLESVWRYSEAIESSGKTYLVEPLFLSMLLTQEERIAFLQGELQTLRDEIQAWKSKAGS
jgi:hypothetical protein